MNQAANWLEVDKNALKFLNIFITNGQILFILAFLEKDSSFGQ